jgi:hypothetical protein
LLQATALVIKGLIMTAKNARQDALLSIIRIHIFQQLSVSFGEGLEDRNDITCSAGYIIASTAWIHDAQTFLSIGIVRGVWILGLRG